MVEGSVGACHGGPYGVGAALRTASMSSARASASASPMAISAFRYSGCRACGAGIRGCRRDDRACWPDVREEQPATPAGRPGSDRVRGHPHRHIAASNEGLIVGRPVRHPIRRLIPGMNLRLHPRSVAPAEGPEKCGPRRPTRSGYSCNNAAARDAVYANRRRIRGALIDLWRGLLSAGLAHLPTTTNRQARGTD